MHGSLHWSPAEEGVTLGSACFRACSSGSERCLRCGPDAHLISPEQGGKLGHKRVGAIYKSHKELELDIQTSRRGLSILLHSDEHRLYGNLLFSDPRVWGLVIFLLVNVAINLSGYLYVTSQEQYKENRFLLDRFLLFKYICLFVDNVINI